MLKCDMLKYDIKSQQFIAAELGKDDGRITVLYARLSKDDDNAGESGSITNQRDFLLKYAIEHELKNVWFIADDGFSGTNFERPGLKAILELMQQGRVANLLVKDHSRLGRDRLKVGILTEKFTTEYDTRYIAVNDNIDSEKGIDDMVAFRELFNEFYPRDTSKKIRAVLHSKGENGERLCTRVPYGYNGDKYAWEIDPEAAAVVKEIFAYAMGGLGPTQIANRLYDEGRLNPTAYRLAQGKKTQSLPPDEPTRWDTATVVNILERIEYTGCTANFKTRKLSYKSPKQILLPKEEWKVFPNTHPAIIDQETFDRVQELRQHRRRPTKTGRHSIFSGLMYCADCGAKMYYGTRRDYERTQDNFRCANYKASAGTCTSHYIREVVLYDFVLAHLRQTLAYIKQHEAEFVQAKLEQSISEQKRQAAQKRKELVQANYRMDELTNIFKKLYEDNISGKLNDTIFNQMLAGYEKERNTLAERIAALSVELEQAEDKAAGVDKFIVLVRKYTDIEELDATILNEFIERIEVHDSDKRGKHRQQKIDIVYNFNAFPAANDITTISDCTMNNNSLPNIMLYKICNTIYIITSKFSDQARETAAAKMQRLILNAAVEN